MEFLLTLYSEESLDPAPGSDDFNAMMNAFGPLQVTLDKDGVFRGGHGLQPVSTAKTLRIRNNQSQISEGPFAETKEVLGGYYVLDCKDMDEAMKYAKMIPVATWGTVEIRPVMIFE